MVRQAIAEAGAAPRSSFVLGDTSFDMAMAAAAGALPIGAAWGYHEPEELLDAGAVAVAEQPLDVLDAGSGACAWMTTPSGGSGCSPTHWCGSAASPIFFLGIAIIYTDLARPGGWPQVGAVIAILGVIDAMFAPRILKKGWEREEK